MLHSLVKKYAVLDFPTNRYQYLYLQINLTAVLGT